MAQVSTLIIDHTKVADSLTDFPVYVDLSDMNAEFWATVANGGGDIRVFKSDGTTELPREVVSCDTGTETGELHFKYTGTLSSSVDTEIQIHADGTSSDYATTDTYGAENVWSDYKAMYHFKETSGGVADAAGNFAMSATGSPGTADGKIGKARTYPGSTGTLHQSSTSPFPAQDVSVTWGAWVRPDITGRGDWMGQSAFIKMYSGLTTSRFSAIKNFNSGGVLVTSGSDFTTGVWYRVIATYNPDTDTIELFVNGVSQGTGVGTGTPITTSNVISVGAEKDSGGVYNPFTGGVDEAFFRGGVLSSDWITTEYNNQNSPSTFYTAEASMPTVNITDTMSLLETTTLPRSLLFSQTDTIEMTDSASLLKVIFVNIVETIGLSEATSSVRSRVISIIDSLGLDEIARARKKIRNLSKNIAIGITNRVKNSMTVKNRSKS